MFRSDKQKKKMSTKSSVDLRAELAELVKRKAEIAVSKKYHRIHYRAIEKHFRIL